LQNILYRLGTKDCARSRDETGEAITEGDRARRTTRRRREVKKRVEVGWRLPMLKRSKHTAKVDVLETEN